MSNRKGYSFVHPDCIVVGAGWMGTFAALEMADRGMEVAVVDAANPAVLLNDLNTEPLLFREYHPDALNCLRRKSLRHCRQILEPILNAKEFQTISELQLLTESADVAPAEQESRQRRANGCSVDFIRKDVIKSVDSAINSEIVGGILHENLPAIDSGELYRGLWRLCEASEGISMRWDTRAVGITIENEKATAVRSLEGIIEGGCILIAAGAETLSIVSSAGIQLPMITKKRYRLVGQPIENVKNYIISEFVSSRAEGNPKSTPQANGELNVVLSVSFQKNKRPLVGDGCDFVTVNRSLDKPALREIRRRFIQVLPGYSHVVLENVVSRLDVVIFDSLPVIGAAPDIEGLYLAVDQRREKDLMAPALGELAARVIVTGDISDEEKLFSPERFPQTAPGGRRPVTD